MIITNNIDNNINIVNAAEYNKNTTLVIAMDPFQQSMYDNVLTISIVMCLCGPQILLLNHDHQHLKNLLFKCYHSKTKLYKEGPH